MRNHWACFRQVGKRHVIFPIRSTATQQDFDSPERTAAAGVAVGWRIEIEPGVHYRYGTTYDGAYDWMIEFDLSEPYAHDIPAAWGADQPPSRIPGPP